MLGVLAGISAGTNILGGLIQGISGAKRARRARREIQNYQRQDLQNAFRGVSVSTMGADLQREEANRALATTVNAAQRMGTRGLGMATNAMRSNAQIMRNIGANLDQQRTNIDRAVAADDARIRQMQERREEADLAGLGQEYNVGRQEAAQGFTGAGNALFNAAMMYSQLPQGGGGAIDPTMQPVKTFQSGATLAPAMAPTGGLLPGYLR